MRFGDKYGEGVYGESKYGESNVSSSVDNTTQNDEWVEYDMETNSGDNVENDF